MKRINLFLALLLALSFSFLIFSCAEKNEKEETASYDYTINDAEINCAFGSKKILSSMKIENYENDLSDKIAISAAKNEYESAQIIVTAKKDLAFTVSISDLVNVDNHNMVINKDNFNIFIEHYIEVSKNYHHNGAPLGNYPDALIPQENAIEYGINVVEEGSNGAAYLEFFIPKNTEAGTYEGKAIVNVGGGSSEVPISLKVYDVCLPDQTSSKSLFTINGNNVSYYELDSTEEITDKYVEFLVKHRLSPSSIPEGSAEGNDQFEKYANSAYAWYQNGLSTVGLQGYSTNDAGHPCFNKVFVKGQILALAKKSLEVNVDLVSLAVLYDWPIDEPFYISYSPEAIDHNINLFNQILNECATELSELEGFDSSFGKTIIQSVKNVPLLITDYIDDEFRYTTPLDPRGSQYFYMGKKVCLCPKFDGYNKESVRNLYDTTICKEKWWYGCNNPSYPHPSYHIDDTMTSAISIGWMMADYDVIGNLYWGVNVFLVNGQYVEEPYSLVDTNTGANGEGTIIYPGKVYGVDGPVASIRLKAVLDGNEDYEIFKIIKDNYERKGFSADSIISMITSSIYTGTEVIGDSKEYEDAREVLLVIAESISQDTELIISNINEIKNEIGEKSFDFTINVSNGTELYDGNSLLTGTNNTYHIVKKLDQEKNYLDLTTVKNGKSSNLKLYLGGIQKIYVASNILNDEISGDFDSKIFENDAWKLDYTNSQKKELVISHSSMSEIGASTGQYIIELNNLTTESVKYKVFITYSKFGKVELTSGDLAAGANQITITTFPLTNWTRNGNVESITIKFESGIVVSLNKISMFGV